MDHARLASRVNLIGPWLRARAGGRVVKIGLDAGLGCPHRPPGATGGGCVFCPPGAAGRGLGHLDLADQWARGLERLTDPQVRALAYFQAHTSTHAPAALLADLYARALELPRVAGLVVSTRPDCLDEATWRLLADLAARGDLWWLELGLQSAQDATLRLINRGHDVACFREAAARAAAMGIPVCAHVVLGLPGETPEQVDVTASLLCELDIWSVKIHNLLVLAGAPLADWWRQARFTPWSLEQFAQGVARFLALLPAPTLVHRLAADPGGETLLAPDWAQPKHRVLTAVAEELERRRWRQGCLRI